MAWVAGFALAGAWLVHQPGTMPAATWLGFAVPLAALLTWCLLGGRPCCIVLLCGWVCVRAHWNIADRWPEALARTDHRVTVTICEFPRRSPGAVRFTAQTEPDPLLPSLPRRLYLSWYEPPAEIAVGERWQMVVRLRPPRGLSNPGAFDFEQWLYRRGVGATGYVRSSALNQRLPAKGRHCHLGRLRAHLAERIEQTIPGHRAAPYVVGIAVGATHGLREEDCELLRRTGTTHLMAISGLNIAMVAVPFLLLGRLLVRLRPVLGTRFPAAAGLAPALLAAVAYSALAGFEVSTVRALVMLVVASLYVISARTGTVSDALAVAAVAILVIDPFAVLAPGLWLSFAGVGCLLLAAAGRHAMPLAPDGATGRRPRFAVARHIVNFTRMQAVLGLGLVPLTIAWFAQVSVIATFTNLVAIPLFSFLIMPLTLSGTALLPLRAGAFLLQLAADLLGLLLVALEHAGNWPFALWRPPPVTAGGLTLATLAVLLLCWPRPLPMRWAGCFGLLPILVGTGEALHPGEWRVVVFDVGQGLAVLVQTARHALLYDAGPQFRGEDAATSAVLPALRALGVRGLDVLVVSHDDADHKGGAQSVLKAFPTATLVAGRPMDLAAVKYHRCSTGASWAWDGVTFSLTGPDATRRVPSSDNDASCILQVRSASGGLLLPGDISRERESELVGLGLIEPAEVVVAPHHGSRSSSGPAFVETVRPKFVIASAGYRNRWNFPAADVLSRWQRTGACTIVTADAGAVIVGFPARGPPRLLRRQRIDGASLWTIPPVHPPDCPIDGVAR